MKLRSRIDQLLPAVFIALTVAGAEEPGRREGVIDGAGGQPLSQAWVFVYSAAPREGPSVICPTCYPDCVKRARTDAQGHFLIEPVAPDLMFRLLVLAKGYRPDFIKDVDPQFGGAQLTLKPLRIAHRCRRDALGFVFNVWWHQRQGRSDGGERRERRVLPRLHQWDRSHHRPA